MQKGLIGILALALIAGGAFFYSRTKVREQARSSVKLLDEKSAKSATFRCVKCEHQFRLDQGTRVHGRHDVVHCPKCGAANALSASVDSSQRH